VTQAAGVLPSSAEFDRLRERVSLLEAIDAGLADEQAGRVVSHAAVVSEMKRRAARRTSKR
jgi:predicted transcriptional regulator